MATDADYRVKVENAYKSYGNHRVLNGINLTTRKASIYGLLGASGCGKTTLLNCVLGLTKLDQGQIYHEGIKSRKDIGYMPQHISLFKDFTIREIFTFYGRLYGLTKVVIAEQTENLIQLFDLHGASHVIKSLSGGEQRKVSLAITVIHKPILLILDEPTVGMDCLLGERIWKYFQLLKEQGTSILITTHYFQEAALCSQIGFMRNGVILAEDTPSALMITYNSNNLEDILLLLSAKQESNKSLEEPQMGKGDKENENIFSINRYITKQKPKTNLFPAERPFSLHRLHAQLAKNISWHTSHYLVTAALLVYPMIIAIIFALITSDLNTKTFTVGMVVDDFLNSSSHINNYCFTKNINNYNHTEHVILDEHYYNLSCNLTNPILCLFIENINSTFQIAFYSNSDDALEHLEKSEISAFLHVPQNFTSNLMGRIEYGVLAKDEIVYNSIIPTTLDSKNFVIHNIMYGNLNQIWWDFFQNLLTDCGLPPKIGELPFKLGNPIFGAFNKTFSESTIPGFLNGFSAFYPMIYTASVIMTDKVQGIVIRNYAAGMKYKEVVLAHFIVQFALMVIQNITMLFVFFKLFNFDVMGSPVFVFFIQLFSNIFGFSIGYIATEIFAHEMAATYFCIGATIIVFHLSGTIWPQEGFHKLIRWLNWFVPSVSVTKSFSSVITYNFPITNSKVYKGIIVNIFAAIAILLISAVIHSRKK